MQELRLTTWERFHLLQAIPDRGPTSEVRKHLRLMDLLALTEEEKVLVGWRDIPIMTPQGPARSSTWGNEKHGAQVGADYEFVIEIEDADAVHLKRIASKYAEWPTHKNTAMLEDKLKELAK